MLNHLTLLSFASALLLAAGLLFNIQPMVGKMLLPLVGGSPAVWNVAMAFFQISLLLGYLLAHLLSRLPALAHALLYLAALAGASLFLPIALPSGWLPDPNGYIAGEVLQVLFISVAIPFITLSLSAPTLQRLFSTTTHHQATDPYFLYAASNLGSFVGLLIYPFLLEPRLDIPAQTELWRMGYYGLIALVCGSVLLLRVSAQSPAPSASPALTAPPIGWPQRWRWLLLAFIPSSLTLGVTSYITTDVAPTPLLWVATLGLYLLTFILAFARRGEVLREKNLATFHVAGCLALVTYLIPYNFPWLIVGVSLLAFFGIALACHTLLARQRPPATQLTDFYFWLSLGGALGGSFNAFLAPLIFDNLYEYPILLAAGLLAFIPTQPATDIRRRLIAFLVIFGFLAVMALVTRYYTYEQGQTLLVVLLISVAIIAFRMEENLYRLAVGLMVFSCFLLSEVTAPVVQARDFFGTLRVLDKPVDETTTIRELHHGNTLHGVQILRKNAPTSPAGYYSEFSPISAIFRNLSPHHVAIIGLGTGGINCYAAPSDRFTFIEISSLVADVAKDHFSFITDCPPPELIIGDGRLEMMKLNPGLDLIVVDAFSSDAIPIHLITREAIQLYLSKLRDGGTLAIHISNRFFRLAPMLAQIGAEMDIPVWHGRSAKYIRSADAINWPSEWLVFTHDKSFIKKLQSPEDKPEGQVWFEAQTDPAIHSWTDNYSDLLSVLKGIPGLYPADTWMTEEEK